MPSRQNVLFHDPVQSWMSFPNMENNLFTNVPWPHQCYLQCFLRMELGMGNMYKGLSPPVCTATSG